MNSVDGGTCDKLFAAGATMTNSEITGPGLQKKWLGRVMKREQSILAVVLVVLIIAVAIMTGGRSLSARNVRNVLFQITSRGISSIGQLFVVHTGGIDLSVGGLAAFSLVLGGVMTLDTGPQLPLAGILPIMVLVGLGVGALNGLSISRLGMPALIVTLAVWQMVDGIAYQICGGMTIHEFPDAMAFGQLDIAGVPIPVAIFAGVAVVAYVVLYHTTFGRSVYAIGGNPMSSWLSGIKVQNVTFLVFTICGLLSGVAGVVSTSRAMCATMVGYSSLVMDTIAAVCIGGVSLTGGRGSLLGVILGVLIIGVINNGMNVMGLNPAFQELVRGAVIFSAVAVDYARRRARA